MSREYELVAHLCLCGCGAKIVTPLGPAEWTLTEHHNVISLSPSVVNGSMGCRPNYEITNSTVQ